MYCTVKNNVEEMIVYIFFLAPRSIEFEADFDFFLKQKKKGTMGQEEIRRVATSFNSKHIYCVMMVV